MYETLKLLVNNFIAFIIINVMIKTDDMCGRFTKRGNNYHARTKLNDMKVVRKLY